MWRRREWRRRRLWWEKTGGGVCGGGGGVGDRWWSGDGWLSAVGSLTLRSEITPTFLEEKSQSPSGEDERRLAQLRRWVFLVDRSKLLDWCWVSVENKAAEGHRGSGFVSAQGGRGVGSGKEEDQITLPRVLWHHQTNVDGIRLDADHSVALYDSHTQVGLLLSVTDRPSIVLMHLEAPRTSKQQVPDQRLAKLHFGSLVSGRTLYVDTKQGKLPSAVGYPDQRAQPINKQVRRPVNSAKESTDQKA
ncbi:hypothetical protein U1Q18_030725 [Sarracenia purpurea var. burkii]